MIISSIRCLVLGTEHVSRCFPGRAAGRISPLERSRERHLHGRSPKPKGFLEPLRGWFVWEQRMEPWTTASIIPASVQMDIQKKPSLSPSSARENVTAGPTLPSGDRGARGQTLGGLCSSQSQSLSWSPGLRLPS